MKQIICDNLRKHIKDQIKYDNECSFQFEYQGAKFCHFLVDPKCDNYGDRLDLPFVERCEFYRCKL